jgi:glutaredoxin 3
MKHLQKLKDKKGKIVIFTRSGCIFCSRIIDLFDENSVKYINYCLDKDFTREKFKKMFGQNATFPRVVINNKLVGGYDDTVKLLSE